MMRFLCFERKRAALWSPISPLKGLVLQQPSLPPSRWQKKLEEEGRIDYSCSVLASQMQMKHILIPCHLQLICLTE